MESRGGSLTKEASWRPLSGGALYCGGSLNKEASCRPLYGGEQGGEERSFMETIVWWSALLGGKFKSRSFMQTIVWWRAGGEV